MPSEAQLAAARVIVKECGIAISDHSLGKLVDAAEKAREVPAARFEVTDGDVYDACMTWRHDFGLLHPDVHARVSLTNDMRKVLTRYAERVAERQDEERPASPVATAPEAVKWDMGVAEKLLKEHADVAMGGAESLYQAGLAVFGETCPSVAAKAAQVAFVGLVKKWREEAAADCGGLSLVHEKHTLRTCAAELDAAVQNHHIAKSRALEAAEAGELAATQRAEQAERDLAEARAERDQAQADAEVNNARMWRLKHEQAERDLAEARAELADTKKNRNEWKELHEALGERVREWQDNFYQKKHALEAAEVRLRELEADWLRDNRALGAAGRYAQDALTAFGERDWGEVRHALCHALECCLHPSRLPAVPPVAAEPRVVEIDWPLASRLADALNRHEGCRDGRPTLHALREVLGERVSVAAEPARPTTSNPAPAKPDAIDPRIVRAFAIVSRCLESTSAAGIRSLNDAISALTAPGT